MKKLFIFVVWVSALVVIMNLFMGDSDNTDYTEQIKAVSIPGIQPVDIYGTLKSRGFNCDMSHGSGQVYWKCTSSKNNRDFTATVYSKRGVRVRKVEAVVNNYSRLNTGSISKDYFGLLATLPYDGSEPAKAKRWVQSNINRTTSTTIGGIKYQIYANAKNNRILEISK